ncbi:methyl-accepting chemotaxis protein [Erythrobacter sp. SDW2]|uniref:methyl-accepting chemotaxis protein n=1 Tax=Erythrobacter sp. SDW2 TaxID=2907154 RepID=UPI001F3FE6A6|nr:methyl-accepting chemotaxis protein [Erythrobacter sp. SDW2]UIP07643.1 methyl-accepting chemotaxis protein [Erythrobacter sp. SDW2]
MSAVDELTREWAGTEILSAPTARNVELRGNRTILERAYGALTSNQKMALSVVLPISLIVLPGAIAMVDLAGSARVLVAGAIVFGVVAMLIFGWVLSREILGVTNVLGNSLYRIADGDVDFSVPCRDRTDEYGHMARAIEVLRINTQNLVSMSEQEQQAQREQQHSRERQVAQLLELADHFDRTVADVVSGVAAAASQLHATASDMSRTAEQSTDRSEEVARSMEEAAAGASAAAAASDEFAMSIGEISRQAADSAEMARKARTTAGEADETISALDQAATQIGQVVELISTIASRTNLLALNASIEAARGGEAGRGFAVVASEVKELASQTTRATEDVAAQIKAIQESTGASVSALRSVSGEIQQIESTAIAIASAVDQQSVAGQDLARSIDRAARNSENVGQHVREVRENALRTGSAAAQVLNSASELEKQASTLRTQVDGFMAKIRAGTA